MGGLRIVSFGFRDICVCARLFMCVGSSTVMRFSVQGLDGTIPGPRLAKLLRSQLLREKTEFLLFKVLRVDTVSECTLTFQLKHFPHSYID